MIRTTTALLLTALLALSLTLAPPPALAAPAADVIRGELVSETEHFRFFAAPGTRRNTERIAAIGEARLNALCHMIDACSVLEEMKRSKVEIWLASDADSFATHFSTAHDGGAHPMSEWAVGVTFVGRGKVVLRAHGSALFSLYETFDHELSHVLLHRAVGEASIPRWFSEGVAIWQAGESVVDRMASAQRAAMTSNLVPLASLDGRFPLRGMAVGLAYAQSALFVRWLGTEYGARTVPGLVRGLRTTGDFETAFRAVTGTTMANAEAEWREDFENATSWVALLSDQNLSWGLLSLLFMLVSFLKVRDRRRAMAMLGEREAAEADALDGAQPLLSPEGQPTLH